MTKTYNDALEWAAQWIEDTLRNGPETNERTIEFGANMAMTLRAAKLSDADLPRAAAQRESDSDRLQGMSIDDLITAYLGVLEELDQLRSTSRVETGLKLEAALTELQERHPNQWIRLTEHRHYEANRPANYFKTVDSVEVWVDFYRVTGNGIEECMDRIRAWAKSRAGHE